MTKTYTTLLATLLLAGMLIIHFYSYTKYLKTTSFLALGGLLGFIILGFLCGVGAAATLILAAQERQQKRL